MLCGFWYAGEVGALTSASKALLVALGLAEPQEQVFVPRMRLTIGKEARWRMQKAVKFRKKHGQCVPRSGQVQATARQETTLTRHPVSMLSTSVSRTIRDLNVDLESAKRRNETLEVENTLLKGDHLTGIF